ncbi:MAG: O-antigen ligase family protein, partial [Bacilli bacterium]|nr:O-antigen ligase family protein [Bacilli bacterium]
MNKVLENIKDNIMELNIIEIFILISPFIDLLTSFFVRLNISITIGMGIRILFLGYMLYYLIIINKTVYRKVSIIYVITIFIYLILSLYCTISIKGISVLMLELRAVLKSFYFPVILLCFFNFFRENNNTFRERILVIVSIIYLSIILLADITNTAFLSYASGKLGHAGWFYSPNEIG